VSFRIRLTALCSIVLAFGIIAVFLSTGRTGLNRPVISQKAAWRMYWWLDAHRLLTVQVNTENSGAFLIPVAVDVKTGKESLMRGFASRLAGWRDWVIGTLSPDGRWWAWYERRKQNDIDVVVVGVDEEYERVWHVSAAHYAIWYGITWLDKDTWAVTALNLDYHFYRFDSVCASLSEPARVVRTHHLKPESIPFDPESVDSNHALKTGMAHSLVIETYPLDIIHNPGKPGVARFRMLNPETNDPMSAAWCVLPETPEDSYHAEHAFSPDGKRIAWAVTHPVHPSLFDRILDRLFVHRVHRDRGYVTSLYVSSSDGKTAHKLTSVVSGQEGAIGDIHWLPDCRHFSVSDGKALYILNCDR
jgi:hypothetical protein